MTTLDRSKQMNLVNEDQARAHPGRRRCFTLSELRLAREAVQAQSARVAMARMLYGAGR